MELTPNQLLTGIKNGRQQGLNDTALDILRRLLSETKADGSDFGLEWEEVLEHALALGDEDSALEVTRRLIARFPDNARYPMLMAERLSRVGRSETSLAIMEKIKPELDANPAIDHFIGVYSGHVGKLKQSRDHFRKAVTAKPDFGDAWAMLGASNGLTEADLPTLTKIVDDRAPHALPGAAYALGTLYHALGQPENAWMSWQIANDHLASQRPFNLDGELAAMKAIQDADNQIWNDPTPLNPKNPQVLFVVGAPRSGTSLVEQILASGSETVAMGETMFSRVATWPLGNLSSAQLDKIGAFGPPGVTWERLGSIYRHLATMRTNGANRVTDKGALLHLFVGALARMLPNAKFVWVKRDARDVALSGFRSYLADGNRWRHSMTDAAAYLRAHDEIMQFWLNKFPKQVYALDYAMLASDPQTETDKMTDFLQIPDIDLGSADFSAANVPTASFAQVRSAISPKSVGSWKTYEQWISPAFG